MGGRGERDSPWLHPDTAPVIYANINTMELSQDQLVIEFREWHSDHAKMVAPDKIAAGQGLTMEIFKYLPVKGIAVLTFGAAFALYTYLHMTMPHMLAARAATPDVHAHVYDDNGVCIGPGCGAKRPQ